MASEEDNVHEKQDQDTPNAELSCTRNPHFAIICSFFDEFSSMCGIQAPSYEMLKTMIDDKKHIAPELIDLHVRLLRKAKRNVSADKWEKGLNRFCYIYYPDDYWLLEQKGYMQLNSAERLLILKHLIEAQFDYNVKFKTEINKLDMNKLRLQPIGIDKNGYHYWAQMDKDLNIKIYKEDLDDEKWDVVAEDRNEVTELIKTLMGVRDMNRELENIVVSDNSESETDIEENKENVSEEDEDDDDEDEEYESDTYMVLTADEEKTCSSKPINRAISSTPVTHTQSKSHITVAPIKTLDDQKLKDHLKKMESHDMLRHLMDDTMSSSAKSKLSQKLQMNTLKTNSKPPDKPGVKLEEILKVKLAQKLGASTNSNNHIPQNNSIKKINEPEVVTIDDDEIVEPTIVITGVGSGKDCNMGNEFFEDEIEEDVMYVYGVGSGFDCCAGNEEDDNAGTSNDVPKANIVHSHNVDNILKKPADSSVVNNVQTDDEINNSVTNDKKKPTLWTIDDICKSNSTSTNDIDVTKSERNQDAIPLSIQQTHKPYCSTSESHSIFSLTSTEVETVDNKSSAPTISSNFYFGNNQTPSFLATNTTIAHYISSSVTTTQDKSQTNNDSKLHSVDQINLDTANDTNNFDKECSQISEMNEDSSNVESLNDTKIDDEISNMNTDVKSVELTDDIIDDECTQINEMNEDLSNVESLNDTKINDECTQISELNEDVKSVELTDNSNDNACTEISNMNADVKSVELTNNSGIDDQCVESSDAVPVVNPIEQLTESKEKLSSSKSGNLSNEKNTPNNVRRDQSEFINILDVVKETAKCKFSTIEETDKITNEVAPECENAKDFESETAVDKIEGLEPKNKCDSMIVKIDSPSKNIIQTENEVEFKINYEVKCETEQISNVIEEEPSLPLHYMNKSSSENVFCTTAMKESDNTHTNVPEILAAKTYFSDVVMNNEAIVPNSNKSISDNIATMKSDASFTEIIPKNAGINERHERFGQTMIKQVEKSNDITSDNIATDVSSINITVDETAVVSRESSNEFSLQGTASDKTIIEKTDSSALNNISNEYAKYKISSGNNITNMEESVKNYCTNKPAKILQSSKNDSIRMNIINQFSDEAVVEPDSLGMHVPESKYARDCINSTSSTTEELADDKVPDSEIRPNEKNECSGEALSETETKGAAVNVESNDKISELDAPTGKNDNNQTPSEMNTKKAVISVELVEKVIPTDKIEHHNEASSKIEINKAVSSVELVDDKVTRHKTKLNEKNEHNIQASGETEINMAVTCVQLVDDEVTQLVTIPTDKTECHKVSNEIGAMKKVVTEILQLETRPVEKNEHLDKASRETDTIQKVKQDVDIIVERDTEPNKKSEDYHRDIKKISITIKKTDTSPGFLDKVPEQKTKSNNKNELHDKVSNELETEKAITSTELDYKKIAKKESEPMKKNVHHDETQKVILEMCPESTESDISSKPSAETDGNNKNTGTRKRGRKRKNEAPELIEEIPNNESVSLNEDKGVRRSMRARKSGSTYVVKTIVKEKKSEVPKTPKPSDKCLSEEQADVTPIIRTKRKYTKRKNLLSSGNQNVKADENDIPNQIISTSATTAEGKVDSVEPIRQKRKYTKRKNVPNNVSTNVSNGESEILNQYIIEAPTDLTIVKKNTEETETIPQKRKYTKRKSMNNVINIKSDVSEQGKGANEGKHEIVTAPQKRKYTKKKDSLNNSLNVCNVELDTPSNVRQSRRLAQIRIKEQCENKYTASDIPDTPKKGKEHPLKIKITKTSKSSRKSEMTKKHKTDKKIIVYKPSSDESEEETYVVDKGNRKDKKKYNYEKNDRKFDIQKAWKQSSDSSSEEEEEIEDEEEEIVIQDVSDHEFSPESEDNDTDFQPVKRARTARSKPKEDEIVEGDQCCQSCNKSDQPEWIILCDKCDEGWHASCLKPPVMAIPEGDWFCPPCQHIKLIGELQKFIKIYDVAVKKKNKEEARKKRIQFNTVNEANCIPSKPARKFVPQRQRSMYVEVNSDDEFEEDNSNSDEGGCYQLRTRRQANVKYRMEEYEALMNSAIQEDLPVTEITEILTEPISSLTEKKNESISSEKTNDTQLIECNESQSPLRNVMENVEASDNKDRKDESNINEEQSSQNVAVPLLNAGRNKRKRSVRLTNLDASAEEDSDDDFKGSSAEEPDEESDKSDSGTDYSGYNERALRRSTRARVRRYDKDFINDDDSDEDYNSKSRKKKRVKYSESESEEDSTWGSRKKNRNTYGPSRNRRRRIKMESDSDESAAGRKRNKRVKYGLEEDEESYPVRRTRGKKINYVDMAGSNSEEEISPRKKKRSAKFASDDEYNSKGSDNDSEASNKTGISNIGEPKAKTGRIKVAPIIDESEESDTVLTPPSINPINDVEDDDAKTIKNIDTVEEKVTQLDSPKSAPVMTVNTSEVVPSKDLPNTSQSRPMENLCDNEKGISVTSKVEADEENDTKPVISENNEIILNLKEEPTTPKEDTTPLEDVKLVLSTGGSSSLQQMQNMTHNLNTNDVAITSCQYPPAPVAPTAIAVPRDAIEPVNTLINAPPTFHPAITLPMVNASTIRPPQYNMISLPSNTMPTHINVPYRHSLPPNSTNSHQYPPMRQQPPPRDCIPAMRMPQGMLPGVISPPRPVHIRSGSGDEPPSSTPTMITAIPSFLASRLQSPTLNTLHPNSNAVLMHNNHVMPPLMQVPPGGAGSRLPNIRMSPTTFQNQQPPMGMRLPSTTLPQPPQSASSNSISVAMASSSPDTTTITPPPTPKRRARGRGKKQLEMERLQKEREMAAAAATNDRELGAPPNLVPPPTPHGMLPPFSNTPSAPSTLTITQSPPMPNLVMTSPVSIGNVVYSSKRVKITPTRTRGPRVVNQNVPRFSVRTPGAVTITPTLMPPPNVNTPPKSASPTINQTAAESTTPVANMAAETIPTPSSSTVSSVLKNEIPPPERLQSPHRQYYRGSLPPFVSNQIAAARGFPPTPPSTSGSPEFGAYTSQSPVQNRFIHPPPVVSIAHPHPSPPSNNSDVKPTTITNPPPVSTVGTPLQIHSQMYYPPTSNMPSIAAKLTDPPQLHHSTGPNVSVSNPNMMVVSRPLTPTSYSSAAAPISSSVGGMHHIKSPSSTPPQQASSSPSYVPPPSTYFNARPTYTQAAPSCSTQPSVTVPFSQQHQTPRPPPPSLTSANFHQSHPTVTENCTIASAKYPIATSHSVVSDVPEFDAYAAERQSQIQQVSAAPVSVSSETGSSDAKNNRDIINDTPGDETQIAVEESRGEFCGLVSYFSSQHEDDLDS